MRAVLKGLLVPIGGVFQKRDILIDNGSILDISPDLPVMSGTRVFFLQGHTLLPGFCDMHVHLRQPGYETKETIATGTRAAAAGGFTAVCAMPNLLPAPDSIKNLAVQEEIIAKDALIKVLPYAAITLGREGKEPVDMKALAAHVAGFSDDGSGVQDEAIMHKALILAAKCGALVCAHTEDESIKPKNGVIHAGSFAKQNGFVGIPSAVEYSQLERDIHLVRKTGAHYHACHISCEESVNIVRKAKEEGLPVSCETAPHYIALCDEDISDDGRFKMSPPIRSKKDQNALIEGICDGTIDAIATDHAPHTATEKAGGLKDSLNGVVGLETSFAVCYTTLVKSGKISLETLMQRMAHTPRRLVGLEDNTIKVGTKLDATVVNPGKEYTVNPACFESMGKSTPFAGTKLFGKIVATWANGNIVYGKDNLYGEVI